MSQYASTPLLCQRSSKVARELLLKVQDVGVDADAILQRAGLASGMDAMLRPAWTVSLSPDQFTLIYRECVAALEVHDSRRQGRPPMTKGEVDMLCHCVINCATLADAIAQAAAFCAMLDGRAAELSIATVGAQAEFRMHTFRRRRDIASFLTDLTGLSTYHRLFSWLIGEEIEPLSVEVCYPLLIEEEVAAILMPHPIAYARSDNLLHFPARYLAQPVVRSHAELVDLLKTFPFDLDAAPLKRVSMARKVRAAFGGALARRNPLPALDMLARQFNISGATLKRRLAEEGVSLQQLKARCRHDFAMGLLADDSLSLEDIARRVGFSDATTFSRGFKAWTGMPPSAYRKASPSIE
ncbi:helix-turn-helix transcriptional regulator [Sphingobium estronivorans]|uniref:helix-turn-helix transcriptional regulator n=1 Tax=Sphingobium estronivorans TaxID=1577690 RepID=UPI00123C3C3F|nr:AraC family transcriptional regulator [Sphingobium estronivorans]